MINWNEPFKEKTVKILECVDILEKEDWYKSLG